MSGIVGHINNIGKASSVLLDSMSESIRYTESAPIDKWNDERRKIAQKYIDGINNSKMIKPIEIDYANHVWHLFVIRCQEREKLQKFLLDNDVQTLVHYPIPPHKQSAYIEWQDLSYPITEKIHRQVLSLPISSVLENFEAKLICDILND